MRVPVLPYQMLHAVEVYDPAVTTDRHAYVVHLGRSVYAVDLFEVETIPHDNRRPPWRVRFDTRAVDPTPECYSHCCKQDRRAACGVMLPGPVNEISATQCFHANAVAAFLLAQPDRPAV